MAAQALLGAFGAAVGAGYHAAIPDARQRENAGSTSSPRRSGAVNRERINPAGRRDAQ